MICKICGKKCEKDEYCFKHRPKKPLHATRDSTIKRKSKVDKYSEEEREALNALYIKIWKKRPHKSEISEEKLYTPLRTMFHHILPKQKHKEAIFDEDNIIILTPIEHGNVHINIYRYEEINRRRELLLKKYENYNL